MWEAVSKSRASGVRTRQTRRTGRPAASRLVAAFLAVLAAVLAVVVANPSTPSPLAPAAAQARGPTVPGELLVQFRSGVSLEQQQAYLQARGLTLKRRHFLARYVTVGVPPGGNDAALANAIGNDDMVVSAEEIGMQFPLDAPEPNDPWFYAQRWNFSLVQAQEAWEKTRGVGVIVAVIDTGVAFENYQGFRRGPDFAASQFVYPRNEFDGTSHPNDDWGHGTHIAGTIAEATDNGLEAAGIASDALILPVKACGWVVDQSRYGCPIDVVADAIDWATTHGADVINLSLGGTDPRVDLERAAIQRAQSAGILVVAASGNGGSDHAGDPQLYYPAALPGVVAVGATDSEGVRASYSNYGNSPEDPARTLDLVAPGGSAADQFGIVQNTLADFCLGNSPPEPIDPAAFATCGVRGTSQAAAHVSAVAALILSLRPDLSGASVRELLQCSALDVGELGTDAEHGYGLVQAGAAVRDSDGDGTFDCLDQPEDACGAALGFPTPTIAPGIVAQGMPTPVTTPTPSPTLTPTPKPADTPTPTATETPAPTATATPSATPSPTVSPTAAATACGDVDCDYDVDSVDALGVLRFVAQISEPECIDKGYTNCDGFITAVDALYILRYVAAIPNGGGVGCPVIGYGH